MITSSGSKCSIFYISNISLLMVILCIVLVQGEEFEPLGADNPADEVILRTCFGEKIRNEFPNVKGMEPQLRISDLL